MKTMKLFLGAALAAAVFVGPRVAEATPGMILDSNHLPAHTAADLRTQIGKQRVGDADSFRAVHDLAANAKALDAKARGRKAPISIYLKSLGARAVLPMIEMLAFEAPKDVEPAVKRDMVEALGLLRDARAMPVLTALLERETDASMVRTASEAVARMETEESASKLVAALGAAQGERAAAILGGMGSCHREVIASALSSRLATHPDETTARAAIKSLGRVGSAWAWSTLPQRSEEASTRRAAATALVQAFVAYRGDARQEASDALMMVDEASTPSLIASARQGASPELAAALDQLAARFAKNPVRTR